MRCTRAAAHQKMGTKTCKRFLGLSGHIVKYIHFGLLRDHLDLMNYSVKVSILLLPVTCSHRTSQCVCDSFFVGTFSPRNWMKMTVWRTTYGHDIHDMAKAKIGFWIFKYIRCSITTTYRNIMWSWISKSGNNKIDWCRSTCENKWPSCFLEQKCTNIRPWLYK